MEIRLRQRKKFRLIKKREFDPNLAPGTEKVVQKGEPGTKTITTPTTKNPLTGEKVGEGEPTEKSNKTTSG